MILKTQRTVNKDTKVVLGYLPLLGEGRHVALYLHTEPFLPPLPVPVGTSQWV